MQKKLTITINEEVYAGLHNIIGRRNISQFIESLVRPHVIDKDIEAAYQRMSRDEGREAEAIAWIEGTQDKLVVSVQRKLLEVSQSEPDWDSYGAQPTSLDAVRKAEELFTQIANQFYFTKGEKIRPYDVTPLTNGGMQLEWRSQSGALEVEVHPSIGFRYLLIQGQGDNRRFKEGDNVSTSEIIRLVSGILNGHNHSQSNNPR